MTTRDKNLVKAFGVFLVIVVVGFVITLSVQQQTPPPAKAFVPTPTPTIPPQPVTKESSVKSGDGTKVLSLRSTTNRDGTTMYEFFTNGNPLFAKTLGPDAQMSLPYNAWDPTNTFVFVEQKTQGNPDYYVFRADGSLFATGDKFIDVGAVWTTKGMTYSIREATGWASGTLLIVYTSKDDGTNGPSFWFEIPSTAIIQLWR